MRGAEHRVEDVSYESVNELRIAWQKEACPSRDEVAFLDQAREVAALRDARMLALEEDGRLVGFAQLERDGGAAEVALVYVHPDYRGAGRGSALTRAAAEQAGDVRDLWLCAEDEVSARGLCARLGFRRAWTTVEFLRLM